MRFSERIGKTPIKNVLQVESIDDDLKNSIWNEFLEKFIDKISANEPYGVKSIRLQISEHLWKVFFRKAIDKFPTSPMGGRSIGAFVDYVRDWFFKAQWFEVYDFIEHLCQVDSKANLNLNFADVCNKVLKKEIAGYRIINFKVVQITHEEEVQAIEEAFVNTDKWSSVNMHLKSALSSLAEKTNPNYRNSVKESISAVESLCKIITNDDKATLGKALAEIEQQHNLHGALKSAFSSIYGYTSDSGGIRHALLENDRNVDADEAKFMLISCSAFINFLISKTS